MTATTTATLTEFVLARVAEDEAVAKAALDAPESTWWVDPRKQRTVRGAPSTRVPIAEGLGWQTAAHIARHDPARVLAECEAKRRIVAVLDKTQCPCARAERCVIHDSSTGSPEFARERYLDPVTDFTLRALALPYADHADYRSEWAAS